jgi:threonine-phosphate decarboxylase
VVDLSSNVNPFGPPPGLLPHLAQHLDWIGVLPEVDAASAVACFAAFHGLPADQVLAANGTTQLIYDLPRALSLKQALIVGPTYADYRDGCRRSQVASNSWLSRPQEDFQPDLEAIAEAAHGCDAIYICNPNNPTGTLLGRAALQELAGRCPDKTLIIDESYLPFVDAPERLSLLVDRPPNVLVLHSLSKIFRVPGLRIGFAAGAPELIARLQRYALPWSVNTFALAAVRYLLQPDPTMEDFVRETRRRLEQEKIAMIAHLSAMDNVHCFPSATGFFLVQLPETHRSDTVCRALAREKILVRDCANFEGLSDRFLRISLQDHRRNAQCARALEAILARADLGGT